MQWWCAATGMPWSWRWQWYPGVHLALLGVAMTWWTLGRRLRWPRPPWFPFLTAWLLLLIALDWPLGKLGAGYLASAHTTQFILLAMLIPPALFRAVPEAGWLHWARATTRGSRVLRLHPLIYLIVFDVLVVVTHIPAVVDQGMKSQLGSFGIDMAWLVAGLALWWPIVAPAPLRRLTPLATLGYIFGATIVPTVPAMMMVFADWPLYELYELAPRFSVHFTPNDDLQLAGLLMKLIGDLPLWFAAGLVFFTRIADNHA